MANFHLPITTLTVEHKRPTVKRTVMHTGRCSQWCTQSQLASGGSRRSTSDENGNVQLITLLHYGNVNRLVYNVL